MESYLPSPGHLVLLIPIIAIGGGMLCGMVEIVSKHLRNTRRDEMEATLKMEMLQRGMSADEIQRVLSAKMSDGKKSN